MSESLLFAVLGLGTGGDPSVWHCAATALLGLGIGLPTGRFLKAIHVFWEGTETALKAWRGVLGFVLCVGGGSVGAFVLGNNDTALAYVGGVGLGMTIAFFMRIPTPRSVIASTVRRKLPSAAGSSHTRNFLSTLTALSEEEFSALSSEAPELEARLVKALDAWATLDDAAGEPDDAESGEEPHAPDSG